MKYQLILADPPWQIGKGGKKAVRVNSSGGALDYQTITLSEIQDILWDARSLADKDHILFCWTIDKYLHASEKMLSDLDYKIHARMVWNKVTGIPAAFTIRYGHEYLLYAYHGKLLPVAEAERGKIHTVFTEQVTRHSKKPEISYQIIERLYPDTKKLELFARRERNGWDVFGNEVENSVTLAAPNRKAGLV